MFRRKEESLFDTELLEETDSFSVQPAANNPSSPAATAAAPVAPVAPVVPAAPAAQTTTVAPVTASAQPITRPAAVPPVAPATSSFRPVQPVASAVPAAPASAANTPVSRPTEVKPMNPQGNSQNSISAPSPAQSSAKASNRVLTVGNDILLKGEINSCDRLVIEGKLEATLNDVHTVELAECGSFKGSANVVDAQISGLFEGDLVVTGRLVIYASGKVRGNISYGEIEIERGGELTGSIKMAGSSAQAPKAVRKEAA